MPAARAHAEGRLKVDNAVALGQHGYLCRFADIQRPILKYCTHDLAHLRALFAVMHAFRVSHLLEGQRPVM